MTRSEAIQRLTNFGYPAKEYLDTVQIEVEPRVPANELDRREIHAALEYKVPLSAIRQIDPWTIVIGGLEG